MSDNPFHQAVSEPPRRAATHEVTNHPHFFQAAIEQNKLKQRAARMTRQEMFNNGLIRVEDLDDEELRLGKCRDESGRIPHNPNKTEMVPRDLYDEMVAEHAKRFDENLRQQLDVALSTMADIMVDPTAEPKDKMEAAKWFVDRVRGKSVERVAVHVQKAPWEELLGDVAHVTRAQHEAMKRGEAVLDAEVVELPDGSTNAQARPGAEDGESSDVGLGDERFVVPGTFAEEVPFLPPEPTPTHVAPATSNPTLSEQLRQAQEEAVRVAEARATRQKLIQDAKKRRRALRATGGDVLRKSVDAESFGGAQDRFASVAGDTETQAERDTPPTG